MELLRRIMKYINDLIEKLEQKNICMKRSTEQQMEELCSFVKGKNLPKEYIEMNKNLFKEK